MTEPKITAKAREKAKTYLLVEIATANYNRGRADERAAKTREEAQTMGGGFVCADDLDDPLAAAIAARDAARPASPEPTKEYDLKDAPASGWRHAVEGACNAVAEHRMNDAFVILCALRDNISAYIAKG